MNTYSIEAMMQDGKALQAGTSHYLGTHFAEAQNIRFRQNEAGELTPCHTTSWGVSTRLIGGVIMVHGDDDGLRIPPAISPRQIVIVPMLRNRPEDADVLGYCESLAHALARETALDDRIRVQLDAKDIKSADKRWNWVRRGTPIILEDLRDVANGRRPVCGATGCAMATRSGRRPCHANASSLRQQGCWPRYRSGCLPKPKHGSRQQHPKRHQNFR